MQDVYFLIFRGYQFFCGTTGTPVSDFCWCLSCVSKPEWIKLLSYYRPQTKLGEGNVLHLSVILFTEAGGLPDRDPPGQRPSLNRAPRTETPPTEIPLDKEPPGQRPPWTEIPPSLDSSDSLLGGHYGSEALLRTYFFKHY